MVILVLQKTLTEYLFEHVCHLKIMVDQSKDCFAHFGNKINMTSLKYKTTWIVACTKSVIVCQDIYDCNTLKCANFLCVSVMFTVKIK